MFRTSFHFIRGMIMLKLFVDSLDDVSENAREFYKETEDGGFALQLASKVVAQGKYDRDLKNAQNTARADWVSPEVHQKVVNDFAEFKKSNNVDDIIAQRIKETQDEWAQKESNYLNQVNTYKGKLHSNLLEGSIAQEVAKAGVKSSAITDVLLRAKTLFSVDENDNIIAKNGDEQLFERDGTTPLSMKSWLTKMTKEAPHWFEQSNGGGATGNTTTKPVVNNQPKSSVSIYGENIDKLLGE